MIDDKRKVNDFEIIKVNATKYGTIQNSQESYKISENQYAE